MEVELTCVSSLWEMKGYVRVPAGSLVAGERERKLGTQLIPSLSSSPLALYSTYEHAA